eukprot:COSAG02_NODE_60777_length_270_cov_0.871345_1_plen_47_part_10
MEPPGHFYGFLLFISNSLEDGDTVTFAIDVDASVLNQGHEYGRRMGP